MVLAGYFGLCCAVQWTIVFSKIPKYLFFYHSIYASDVIAVSIVNMKKKKRFIDFILVRLTLVE